MATVKTRPIHFYIPFERVERTDDGCLVEGYAFVNETVKNEGGVRIKRSAMETATPDYMRFANVREMHGRNAAGVATEVVWDEKGALMRAKIVDPTARLKCEEGVYKGFSIGVQPTVMRGKEVEVLDWIETSLVDRPKDPDAVFTAYRADELSEEGADCEVADEAPAAEERVDFPPAEPPVEPEAPRIAPEELAALEAQRAAAMAALAPPVGEAEAPATSDDPAPVVDPPAAAAEPEERAETSATVPVRENLEGKPKFMPREGMVTCRACKGSGFVTPDDDEEKARVDAPALGPVAETPESETISRIAALQADNTALITRAEMAEAEFARVQGELETRQGELSVARERISALEKMPATQNRPVLFPQALERDFFVNRANDRTADLTAVREKLAALQAQRPTDPGEQNALASQVNVLKQHIAALQQGGS